MLIMNHFWEGMFPCEMFLRNDKEYRAAAGETDKQYNALCNRLSPEEKRELDELLERHSSQSYIAHRDAFALGVRLGAMLMMDVFCED